MTSEFERITARLAHLYHTTQPAMARKMSNHKEHKEHKGTLTRLAEWRKKPCASPSQTITFSVARSAHLPSSLCSLCSLCSLWLIKKSEAVAKSISKEARRHAQ